MIEPELERELQRLEDETDTVEFFHGAFTGAPSVAAASELLEVAVGLWASIRRNVAALAARGVTVYPPVGRCVDVAIAASEAVADYQRDVAGEVE